jgi:prolyl oligopeptidase
MNKRRSIEDLRAAAETLQQRLAIPASLTFATGRSAGGWLISKTALTYPQLFGGIILEAPLLDLRAATAHPSTPLYHQEIYEWGKDAAQQLSTLPTAGVADIPFHVATLVPLRDALISNQEAVHFALAARCSVPSNKKVLVMELPNSGHLGANNRHEQREWEDLQVGLITAALPQ